MKMEDFQKVMKFANLILAAPGVNLVGMDSPAFS
jgi:hypothetical protein